MESFFFNFIPDIFRFFCLSIGEGNSHWNFPPWQADANHNRERAVSLCVLSQSGFVH